ncbi:unnamed protein product [Brassica napus]|uniref:(rape) hypothetical protein n=1 Tax=Brassica napus TaxID=3708 RepID=A0A816JME9_BRANA|nr:unnamed protein product [Brassica napus]
MGRGSSVPSHSLRLSRSLLPPTRSLLYLPVYLSLSLCVLNLFFFCSWAELVVVSRGDNIWWYAGLELITYMNLFIFIGALINYILFEASMELESGNIEEKRWSWFRGKGRDTDKKFDGGGRVEIDAVDGGEELVQR